MTCSINRNFLFVFILYIGMSNKMSNSAKKKHRSSSVSCFSFILTISCLIVGRLMQAECGYYSESNLIQFLVIILFLIAQLLTRVQPCSLNQKILTENSSFYSHSLHTLTKIWLNRQQHLLAKYLHFGGAFKI